ncbi:ABC transporter permease [bacterium]|nr:ABC transporter permease [bacterium]
MILGDMAYEYQLEYGRHGGAYARRWYWRQVSKLFPYIIMKSLKMQFPLAILTMKSIKRYMLKNKQTTIMSFLGLSTGLACGLLSMLWIMDEIGFDKFHIHQAYTYRLLSSMAYEDGIEHSAKTPAPLAIALVEELPEVINAARVYQGGRLLLRHGENAFYESRGMLADKEFFSVFSYSFLDGDAASAFQSPLSIVITKAMALKYFGKINAVGEIIQIENFLDVTITGVLANPPQQSHLQFDYLLSMAINGEEALADWEDLLCSTYIQVQPDCDMQEIPEKIYQLLKKYGCQSIQSISTQPLSRIYLDKPVRDDLAIHGNQQIVLGIGVLAMLVLIIASVNYISTLTAQSDLRLKEIGLRKVVGASRTQLIRQIYGEIAISMIIAVLIASMIVGLLLPEVNAFSGKSLLFSTLFTSRIMAIFFIVLTILTGFGGLYPALIIAAMQPKMMFKGILHASGKSYKLRRALVIFQFALSITMMISLLIVKRQLQYISQRPLGYSHEQIIYMPLRGALIKDFSPAKAAVLSNSQVIAVSASSALPVDPATVEWVDLQWPGKQVDQNLAINYFHVDHDFLETMDIKLLKGSSFTHRQVSTEQGVFLLNQRAVEAMGIENPVGKIIHFQGRKGLIAGIVADFHFNSLHRAISPMILSLDNNSQLRYMLVRVAPDHRIDAVNILKSVWDVYNPGYPAEIDFLDTALNNLYMSENRLQTVLLWVSILGLLIAVMGLLSLIQHLISRQRKTLAIKKIIGASPWSLIISMEAKFIGWIGIGNLIAWPGAYFLVNNWLSGFAYRLPWHLTPFLVCGILSVFIVIVVISSQLWQAVSINPVNSLRNE